MVQDTKNATIGLQIPEETQKQFGEIIAMIQESPSMNQDERQYWIDALPVMTPDQVANLKNILENEKKQIQEVNKNYQQGLQKEGEKLKSTFDEAAYLEKRRLRQEAEKAHEAEEQLQEAEILKQIQQL